MKSLSKFVEFEGDNQITDKDKYDYRDGIIKYQTTNGVLGTNKAK